MVNYCYECGYVVKENWKNCPNCGIVLKSVSPQTAKTTLTQNRTDFEVESMLNWAELKGEGNKIQEFTRAFTNEMVAQNLRWNALPTNLNEINLELVNNYLLKGEFHAINKNGDLYYKSFLKINKKFLASLYFGVLVVVLIIAGFLSFSLPEIAMYVAALIGANWLFLGAGVVIGLMNSTKAKREVFFPSSLKSAEAEIRSF